MRLKIAVLAAVGLVSGDTLGARNNRNLETANPVRPLPTPPLGVDNLDNLRSALAPERVRLGRWLFYDTRLSADGTVSCATCHVPDRAFSNGTPSCQQSESTTCGNSFRFHDWPSTEVA